MAYAYICGVLQAMPNGGPLVLTDVTVKSERASRLTCCDGMYFCDFGEPFEAETFGDAAELAEERVVSLKQWLGLPRREKATKELLRTYAVGG